MSKNDKPVVELSLNPRQVKEVIRHSDKVGDSLMIWGPPGIGKSNVIKQYADENYPLRKDNVELLAYLSDVIENSKDVSEVADAKRTMKKLNDTLLDQETNFIDFRLSQIEPSDLRGIPVPEKLYYDEDGRQLYEWELQANSKYITETAVVWAQPKLLKLPANWKGVILFDEINSAMPIVQAASYQLILDRRVGELILPAKAVVIAAGNRETDGGVTFSLATPLRDRMTHVEMKPDLEQYIEDFAIPNMMAAETIAFLKNNMASFNTLSKTEKSHSGGSSPRSWTRVSDYTKLRNTMPANIFRAIVAGRVGDGIAVSYEEFIRNIATLPDVDSILSGVTKKVPEGVDMSCNYFITIGLTFAFIYVHKNIAKDPERKEEYKEKAKNFCQFLHNNYSKSQPELVILAIRTLTDAKVFMPYSDVPDFRVIADEHQKRILQARNMQ